MKIALDRPALLRTLAHVQNVVERRNTVPILANVLIRANGPQVSFTATDMDLELIEAIAAENSTRGHGAVTAPAHTLYEIVRKLPEGAPVELSASQPNQLTLSAGRAHFKLGCLPVEDFPQISEGNYPQRFTLDASDLKLLIDHTKFAISTEETRYYLNGIYLHTSKGKSGPELLRAVATDGHRLARAEMPAPDGLKNLAGIIVPRKTVSELRKLLDEVTGPVEVALSDNKIRFTLGQLTLTSKLIDGTFPNYEQVIPASNDKLVQVEARAFAAAVDRVATITSDKGRAIKLSVAPGHVTLLASSPEAGSASEELEIKYDGPLIDIGFNARYLLDILQQIEGDGAKVFLADAASAVIIQDAGDPSALYVLMPMRV